MSLPLKTDELRVVSGGAGDPKVVAGTANPTSGVAAPEGSIYLRYVASSGQAFVKSGPGDTDWTDLVSVGGTSLDGAYDFGGSGAGRAITVDSGAVQLDSFTSNTQAALQINRQPGASAASVGIDLVMNGNVNTSGAGIQITDPGAGNSIKVTKSNAGSAFFADLTNASAQAVSITVTAAPTSVSPFSIVANTTGTTAALVSISKIPGATTAGNALSVSMGANTTGSGISVSQAGTGAAIEIAAGSFEVANSAAGVSPANRGRLRYNSGTQTFQVSMNGAAYVDITTGASFTLDIGDTIGGSTVGSVLFVGAGGVLQQDNTNFFWDDTNNSLTVTTTTSASAIRAVNADSVAGAMSIRNTNVAGPVDFYALDNGGTARMSWGYGNASYSDTARASRAYVWRNTGVDFVFARTSQVDAILTSTGTMAIGSGLVVPRAQLHVQSASAPVLMGERTTALATGPLTASSSLLTSSVDMADGFGPVHTFQIRDNAGVDNLIAYIGAVRAGGDTTGDLIFTTYAAAVAAEKARITSTGRLGIGTATPAAAIDINLSASTGGFISRTHSFSAGFYSTGLFTAHPGGTFAVGGEDRNIHIQAGANAAGQKNQYITFNGRWSGNIDTPTLTQGLWDRCSGIEFNGATIGPNPNGAINFFVNTGTIGSGAELAVTPTRVMSIAGNGRIGVGVLTPTQPFDVEAILGNTNAKFGSSLGVYVVTNLPNIGFNAYYNAGWKYGKGSVANRAGIIGFDPTNTTGFNFNATTATGNADAAATLTTLMTLSTAAVLSVPTGTLAVGAATATAGTVAGFFNSAAGGSTIEVRATAADGYSSVYVSNNAGTQTALIGYGNASVGATWLQLKNFLHSSGNQDWVFSNTTGAAVTVGITANSVNMQFANGGSAAVSAASTGRIRYNTTGQKFQVSTNGGAYVDLATGTTSPTVERLSVDGAADPTIDTTFVSGTGTDLTLANGSTDGFIKNFVVTGGTGTITPTNLADGNVLTWTATPANVSFIWDASGTTWHVYGNPYNMVTT